MLTTKWVKGSIVFAMYITAMSESYAALSLDRTRAIFEGDEKSIVLKVSNNNKQLPYLAQVWLENGQGEKLTQGPLVVTPPVQRLEPMAKTMIRIAATPDVTRLPQDRESLFYFNLREIPPKSEKSNSLQIALQTKIKLFYRPAAVKAEDNAVWQDSLILKAKPEGYIIENPTPYYITVVGLGASKAQAEDGKFSAVMLAPKSEQMVKSPVYTTPWLAYVNDYGGRIAIDFKCNNSQCTAK